MVREVGKPVGEATGEVARAISILDYYAQACFAAVGEQYPPSLGGLLFTQRMPHGVVAMITPWNFPLAIPLWKTAPALASGNAVLLKPSSEAPACAALLERILAPHVGEHVFRRRLRRRRRRPEPDRPRRRRLVHRLGRRRALGRGAGRAAGHPGAVRDGRPERRDRVR